MAGVRLKRLKIEKYRNVAPGTELHFHDGFNVLLGKNGTGKTTLLNLIAVVLTGSFKHLREEPFEIEYDLAFEKLGVKVIVRNNPHDRDRSASQSMLSDDGSWSYRIVMQLEETHSSDRFTISADALGASLAFDNDTRAIPTRSLLDSQVVSRAFTSVAEEVLKRSKSDTVPSSVNVIFQAMDEQVILSENIGRFDEALGAFDAITAAYESPDVGAILRPNFGFFIEGGKVQARYCHFVPTQVRDATAGLPLPPTATTGPRLAGRELPLLRRFTELADMLDAELVLSLTSRAKDDDGRDRATFGEFEFMIRVDQTTTISHKLLSYGQKRLLSFLYYAAANPDVVIVDELANGMHHDWVQACVDEISGRQSFLVSQDPLLFDFLTFASADEVEKSFILCGLEKRDGRGHFTWKNLDAGSAASFYRAYEAGIQHVSAILRTKGLW